MTVRSAFSAASSRPRPEAAACRARGGGAGSSSTATPELHRSARTPSLPRCRAPAAPRIETGRCAGIGIGGGAAGSGHRLARPAPDSRGRGASDCAGRAPAPASTSDSSCRMTIRLIMFSSSRMLPGQSYWWNCWRSCVGQRAHRPVVAPRVARDEELGERIDLVAPLAQRRHVDLDDLQPVVQVLAELALEHHRLEIAVGGGDDAHVDGDALVAAQLGELGVLQHVQQLGLERRLHLADLVEEDRAAVGLLELADARRRRAGEGALLVAEQLALEQLGRAAPRSSPSRTARCCRDERWWIARATSSLPTPLSPRISTVTSLSATCSISRVIGHHPLAAAPDRAVLVVAQLPPQLGELRHQAALLDRALDRRFERDFAEALPDRPA